jgi:hypothetical protein
MQRTETDQLQTDGTYLVTYADGYTGHVDAIVREDAQHRTLSQTDYEYNGTFTLSHYGYTGAGVQYLADRSTFDAQNRLDTVQTFAANGSLTTDVDYDQANAGTWGSVTRAYDTAGRLDTVMTVNDNASFSTVDYDQANAGTWVRFHAYASVAFVPQRR